jgi:hypothetical protein
MTETEISKADHVRTALLAADAAAERAHDHLADAGYARKISGDEGYGIEAVGYSKAAAAFRRAGMHLDAAAAVVDGFGRTMPPVEPVRERLLSDAARKPVTEFTQYDGFFPGPDGIDSVIRPDEDGDCVFGPSQVRELRNGTPVRVQIEPGVSAAAAARVLRKIAEGIEME